MTHSERMELIGQLVDVFEDFLDAKGITIANDEKADDEYAANIYGTDYSCIADDLEQTLINWNLLDEERR